jgi:hypothetical protein
LFQQDPRGFKLFLSFFQGLQLNPVPNLDSAEGNSKMDVSENDVEGEERKINFSEKYSNYMQTRPKLRKQAKKKPKVCNLAM